MVKHTGLRQVPWQSWAHWVWVADGIFSGCSDRIAAAQNRIKAWQSRGNVPISVETTSALASIQQRDPHFKHELSPGGGLPDDMLRMMYAMAIQRLVNGVVDVSARRNSSSVATRADSAKLPRLLVDIRHETAHNELPGLPLLRSASQQALEWLKVHYWEPQRQALGNTREELKKKLWEHCQLVIDILTPVSKPDDEEIDEDVDGEGKQRLVKVMRTLRNIHRHSLKTMKQERVKVFRDLEDLCLGSTSELVSVLVDDGLLEQGLLPGPEGRDKTQLETDDSETESFDLAAATYTAWRYTICRLSNHLHRLPEMLLVAIVKRIGSRRPIRGGLREFLSDAAGSDSAPVAPTRGLMSTSLSSAPADGSKETKNGLSSSAGLDWLLAWCAWLLGSEDSEAALDSISQDAVQSKTLGIRTKLSVKADFSEELYRELLRSCLYSSSKGGPLVELVSLIALKVGKKKLQQQALRLTKFGSIVQRAPCPDQTFGGYMGSDSVLGSSSAGQPLGGEALEASTSSADPSRTTTTRDGDESKFERVKKQQQEIFARAAPKGTVLSRSCDDGEKVELKTTTESRVKSQTWSSWTPHLQGRKWIVAENWRPCALGMIPSPYSVSGILPSLDLDETAEADGRIRGSQASGDESNSEQQQRDTVEDSAKVMVISSATPDSVDTRMAKRKCDVELKPSSTTGDKRVKKVGRHVHFSVADVETTDSPESLSAKQQRASKMQGIRAQHPGESMLQGCLRLHGHFLPVSSQQLESLKAAVHVL